MIAIKRDFAAYLDEMQVITIILPYHYHKGESSQFTLKNSSGQLPMTIISRTPIEESVKYICRVDTEPEIGEQYWVIDEHGGKTDLQIGAVIRTEAFDEKFFYNEPLGFSFKEEKTIFKLWAPTAAKVKLRLKSAVEENSETVDMIREDKGVWSCTVHRNLDKYLYTYLVCVNLEWKEAVDPYAVSVSANGEYGVVIDLQKTKTEKPALPGFIQPTDAIIYETHIRDFTIHSGSGITRKGTYLGAGEVNTRGRDGELTGLSYAKQLGATHIEFLPFHDFEGVDENDTRKDYNWGYNPLHFNAPDGSYTTKPADPYARIKELKTMIHAVHSQGLRVIMDVVYNHVYIREKSSFEKIVPGYYFRHDEFGMPSNGTGVGNDIASERLMARKFIIDSINYWLEEYQVDGFRFDLMGIIDIDTMNMVRKAADVKDPSIIIIGEGWDLNTPIPKEKKASIGNQDHLLRVGQFNDWFRDSIKGSTFNLYDKGYALGNEYYYEAAKQVLAGSIGLDKKEQGIFHSPDQTVNYVESHDNHTLWDKINACSPNADENISQRQHRLATVMVLLAQGIPFLHSGQEFFRTKKGIGNSYRSPDSINKLDWDRKIRYSENVNYIRGIIQIRKAHKAFRFSSSELIRRHMQFLPAEKPVISFLLNDVGEYGKWRKIIVIINPSLIGQTFKLPEGKWTMLANEKQAGICPIKQVSRSSTLTPISCYVLVSENSD